MSAKDDQIIFQNVPQPPDFCFKFLDYLADFSQVQFGLTDIHALRKPARTATCAQHLDTMDKIQENLAKRMKCHIGSR